MAVLTDRPDGHASAAAREADAVDEVQRTTESQTTAASYVTTNQDRPALRPGAGA